MQGSFDCTPHLSQLKNVSSKSALAPECDPALTKEMRCAIKDVLVRSSLSPIFSRR